MRATIPGAIADLIGAQRIQKTADEYSKAAQKSVTLRITGSSKYHEGKVFEGRVVAPPPYRSWLVKAAVEFHIIAQTQAEALEWAQQSLEDDDLIGSYHDVVVPPLEAEVLDV